MATTMRTTRVATTTSTEALKRRAHQHDNCSTPRKVKSSPIVKCRKQTTTPATFNDGTQLHRSQETVDTCTASSKQVDQLVRGVSELRQMVERLREEEIRYQQARHEYQQRKALKQAKQESMSDDCLPESDQEMETLFNLRFRLVQSA